MCTGVCREYASVRRCAWVCFGMCRCTGVGLGVCGSVQVYGLCTGMGGCGRKCGGVCRYALICMCAHVWDEFSEFLPENRVPTSVDFNMYTIRIF